VFHPWCKKIDKEDYFGQHSGDALTLAWFGKWQRSLHMTPTKVTKVSTYDTNKMCVSYQAKGRNKAIVFRPQDHKRQFCSRFVEPELSLGVSRQNIIRKIKWWADNQLW
jgi:hypothetical protein